MTHVSQDHVDEPMSSDDFLDTFTSYNTNEPPKVSKLSKMPPPKKEPNCFHIDHAYPQGLQLKENQANLHLSANLFHATKNKDPQHSCNTMITMPTLANPALLL